MVSRRFSSLGLVVALLAGMVLPHAGGRALRAAPPPVPGHQPPQPIQPTSGAVAGSWMAAIQEQIRFEEYHVTWQDQTYISDVAAAYQAPNRAQNLRTYFVDEGPVLIPRVWLEGVEGPPWRWEASLSAWGRGETRLAVPQAVLHIEENRIHYRRGRLMESYRNDEAGVHQTFRLSAPPEGERDAPVRLDLRLAGTCQGWVDEGRAKVTFRSEAGDDVLALGGLQASDAAGQPLPAHLSLQKHTLSLVVDDTQAAYPIEVALTIGGLEDSYDWAHTGTAGSQFGFSVATAGDTNGDGYSDIIVGAPYYDNGLAEQGYAAVYPGGATGLDQAPIWTKRSDQGGARYGWSVATAGDVNGDGYADIIVGAPRWEDNAWREDEGGAWIYHGSAAGPHSDPDNHHVGKYAGAHLGRSVATAGDVNGDGYADVIVGAPDHADQAGVAYVWHGSQHGVSDMQDWYAESGEPYTGLGRCVATAGDVNGDGYADVIVGLPEYDEGSGPGTNKGAALVWHGSASGVNGGVNGTLTNHDWMFIGSQWKPNTGLSVSTAGDVNGDGYADVIVGAPQYTHQNYSEGGAAWLFLGSAGGLEADWDNFDYGHQDDAWFGFSVAPAGDVNGDGYGDVIVGAPLYTTDGNQEGRAWVWHGSADGISETNDWHADGENEQAFFGSSVATAGDVNGDGFSDVIIGAPGNLSGRGTAYVYHGSSSSLARTAGWTKRSNKETSLFGFSVGTAGDVNGDGFADIIVGSPYYDAGQTAEGGAFVYTGQAGGIKSAPAWTKFSDKTLAEFGSSVGTAGDVNGDGFSDIIVGAPGWNAGQDDEGMAFVYAGSAGGVLTTPFWNKESDNEDARFGASVGTAGDVDGDGYADVIVGAPFYKDDGRAFVYLGSASRVASAPHWSDDCDQAGSEYGYAVGTAGDVNGDGFSDVIVGAPKWDRGHVNEGGAFVYLGSAAGLARDWVWVQDTDQHGAMFGQAVGTAGDTDGDGLSDIIVGAPGATIHAGEDGEGVAYVYPGTSSGVDDDWMWRKGSGRSGAQFGSSVGTAGDVDGDGYADLIVGARLWSGGTPGEGYEGGAFVYHGGATGPRSAPAWHVEANQNSAHLGTSVATAGDVNGDGYADVIVGAPDYDDVVVNEGKVFVYYGNGGAGVPVALRQRQLRPYFGADPVSIGRLGHAAGLQFELGFLTGSPFGRGRVHYEVEVRPLGEPLDGTDTFFSPAGSDYWFNPELGAERSAVTLRLVPDTAYHWRMRVVYDPATTPFMPASRWMSVPWNGWNEQDLRTGGSRTHLPVVLRSYD